MLSELREAISADHIAIEKTPYAVAMIEGTIDRDAYLLGLVQLYHVHAALEVAVAQQDAIKPFFTDEMRRTQTIKRDLAHFGRQVDDYAVLPETAAIAAEILRLSKTSPFSLIAHIYVLEGSRMGSLVLIKTVAKALQVPPLVGNGIDYHAEGARETPQRLRHWKESVGRAHWETPQVTAITAAAADFMHALCELYDVLPIQEQVAERVA